MGVRWARGQHGPRRDVERGCRHPPVCCLSLPPPCSLATALLFRRGPVPSQHPKAFSLLNPHLGGLGPPQSLQEPEATPGSVSPWEEEQDLGGVQGHSHVWEWETPQPWDFTLAPVAPITAGTLVRFQSEWTVGLGRRVRAAVPHPGRRWRKPCRMLGPSEPCGCGAQGAVPGVQYRWQGTAASGWGLWACCPRAGDAPWPRFAGPP